MEKINREDFVEFLMDLSYQTDGIGVEKDYRGRYFFHGPGVTVNNNGDFAYVIWEIAKDGRFDALQGVDVHSDSMGLGAVYAWDDRYFTEKDEANPIYTYDDDDDWDEDADNM